MKGGTVSSPRATGATPPLTVAVVAAPPLEVTVQVSVDGRCIWTPWRIVYAHTPSPGSSPAPTSHTPRPSAAEPVAGSSGTPAPGRNTRACAVAVAASQANTLTW